MMTPKSSHARFLKASTITIIIIIRARDKWAAHCGKKTKKIRLNSID
jgi:hypothetical protein